MATVQRRPLNPLPPITWELLPANFSLPDDPVDDILHPLLADTLREALELAGLILESALIATNFGVCATVGDKTVVKAPDWVYVASVNPLPAGHVRRSYTPHIEGEVPTLVMEFISETEGGEYSINPHYPYGKWYFYERILQVPLYAIFHPQSGQLDLFRLINGQYVEQQADENGRYWIAELNLFLGLWSGKKAEMTTTWLRWWDADGNLLLWGSEQLSQERQRAEQERQRAEQERQRAEQAHQRVKQLTERLRQLGVDPEELP
jgi:Uma2 family endonuclease